MKYSVFIKLEPYLSDWFINRNGGSQPVELQRNSLEFRFLELHLDKAPKDYIPQINPEEGEIEVYLPHFRAYDIETYNYLSETDKKSLHTILREKFRYDIERDFLSYYRLFDEGMRMRLDDFANSWMSKHGITNDDTNYNSILKILQRLRENKRKRQKRCKK